jgi:hypothetical protein
MLRALAAMDMTSREWKHGTPPEGFVPALDLVPGEPLLIVWDIQNVRMPLEVEPDEVLR